MLTTIELKLVEAGAILALVIAIVVGVWFKAEAHYSAQYETFKGQMEGQARIQKEANDQTTKRINDEAAEQSASMARVIADLSVRLQHASANPFHACQVPGQPVQESVGPGSAANVGKTPDVETPAVPAVSVDPQLLGDILDTAIDSLTADLQFREFERSVR